MLTKCCRDRQPIPFWKWTVWLWSFCIMFRITQKPIRKYSITFRGGQHEHRKSDILFTSKLPIIEMQLFKINGPFIWNSINRSHWAPRRYSFGRIDCMRVGIKHWIKTGHCWMASKTDSHYMCRVCFEILCALGQINAHSECGAHSKRISYFHSYWIIDM